MTAITQPETTMTDQTGHQAILDYWRALGPQGWFRKDEAVDREIGERFGKLHAEASAGLLDHWRGEPGPCLALVIILDQFSRNMFRGDARAFAQDALALQIAREAIAAGFDRQVDPVLRSFLLMPFMHSESIVDQQRAVALFHALGAEGLKYAIIHRDVIARFGRFPHRNAALGRHTTRAEEAFLAAGGFSG